MEESKFAAIAERDGNHSDLGDLGQGRRFPPQSSKKSMR